MINSEIDARSEYLEQRRVELESELIKQKTDRENMLRQLAYNDKLIEECMLRIQEIDRMLS